MARRRGLSLGAAVALAVGVLAALASGANRQEIAGHGVAATQAPSAGTQAPSARTQAPPVRAHPAAPAAPARPVQAAPRPPARPKPNPCAHNTEAQNVLVSIPRQHAWFCARTHLVHESPMTSGAVDLPYRSTPTGVFHVQAKQADTTLTLLSGAQYEVRYWVTFDAPLFGFHDSSWQSFPYGSQRYRTEGSHGCVHLPLPAMAFLYRWAAVGATVTIRG